MITQLIGSFENKKDVLTIYELSIWKILKMNKIHDLINSIFNNSGIEKSLYFMQKCIFLCIFKFLNENVKGYEKRQSIQKNDQIILQIPIKLRFYALTSCIVHVIADQII